MSRRDIERDGDLAKLDLLAVGDHHVLPRLELGGRVVFRDEIPIRGRHGHPRVRIRVLQRLRAPVPIIVRVGDDDVFDVVGLEAEVEQAEHQFPARVVEVGVDDDEAV